MKVPSSPLIIIDPLSSYTLLTARLRWRWTTLAILTRIRGGGVVRKRWRKDLPSLFLRMRPQRATLGYECVTIFLNYIQILLEGTNPEIISSVSSIIITSSTGFDQRRIFKYYQNWAGRSQVDLIAYCLKLTLKYLIIFQNKKEHFLTPCLELPFDEQSRGCDASV